jgi:hypothetical protein
MKRATGRNIYIVDLKKVVGSRGAEAFAARCKDARFSAVWVRLGRGPKLDSNFSLAELPAIKSALHDAGVEMWGWHVPFCANEAAARDEADKVVKWAADHALAGVVLDAERTPDSPRFRGDRAEAEIYAKRVRDGLTSAGRGIALSSHDQPAVHRDLPFAVFLDHVEDNCPQVYYTSKAVTTRLNKSIRDYTPLEATRDFKDRYKPTGNITTAGDVKLGSVATCLAAAGSFIDLVKANGYSGYSFWCWDDAPAEIFQFFQDTPV